MSEPTSIPPLADGDDPSLAHRLPTTVVPRHYELRLAPDLEGARFTGEVRIEAEAVETVTRIVLHAAELTIEGAEVRQGGQRDTEPGGAVTPVLDEATERVVLELGEPLGPGPCTISIEFGGTLNDQLHGFYRSTFRDAEGRERTIATTQFEATDARRAFPCFDEPDRKATFSITLDLPAEPGDLAAFSNGPLVEEEALPGGGRRCRFAETMPMSTYLVAFVVGPLVATEPRVVRGTPVRVVHVPGKEELTSFALDAAAHALEFFTDWFGIAYPAEKLDLVAIPDFAFGAMENLGCVTFRESALLVDPARASRLEQERVADVISHEIAHMWFGDLVTMKWWNGIWLNEAFATLMELLCVDDFRPAWRRWTSFGMERDVAMATDALHHTRPVEYPVGPPEEAQGMFDVLTYQKGASVLRMLERYLGEERFRDGIRRYLDRHRYGNTETADLWQALEEASGAPVGTIMDTWILQGGFPLVSVSDEGQPRVLRQEPFSFAPAGDGPSAIGSRWQVPVLTRVLGGDEAGNEVGRVLLAEETVSVTTPADSTLLVNAGGSGFYRVHYEPGDVRRLAGRLGELDELERFNLLGDTWAAAVAGRAELDDLLELAAGLRDERDPDVWGQLTGALGFLDRAVPDDDRSRVAGYARALVGPVVAELGWDPPAGEPERTGSLRAQLIATLGTIGQDEEIRAEATRRHAAAIGGGAPLHPDLASAIVTITATAGGVTEFETFWERHRKAATPQEEMRYLYALASFPAPELAERAFELAVTEVRTQNAPFVIQLLLGNRENGAATWRRLTGRWDAITARTPANILPRMLDGVKLLVRDEAVAHDVRRFLAEHPLPAGQRTVDQAVERLGINLAFAHRLAGRAGPVLEEATARLRGA
jgi:puromycin-sensitive aminopeptidase